jgi:D-hydroxyproline dehydrogenase subunit beta
VSNCTDAIVIGAGIVGAACAYALAKENLAVRIIDADGMDAATAAGMGHIVVMDDSEAQLTLTHFSQTLWDALAEEFPNAFAFERTGTIWVAADEEEMAEVRRKQRLYSNRGISAEILGPAELQHAEPNLRNGLPGGLLVPNDSVVYPPTAAAFLTQKACDHGAVLSLGKPVSSIGKGTAHLPDGTTYQAKIVINATGQHAADLTPGITVLPRKGHLVITDRYPGAVRHQLVELGYLKSAHTLTNESVAFNVQPRETGQVLIGSSRQMGIDDRSVDTRMLSEMLKRAFLYMPKLAELSAIRVWTGIRAATPDKLPLIGPWGDDETIFLATGHEGLGITTSLATARLVADHVLQRKPSIPIEPYLPSRQFKEGALV